MARLRTTLWALLSSPRAGLWVVGAGLALTAASVVNGVALDDRFHRAMVHGYALVQRAPWDLYRFIPGEPAEMRLLVDRGFLNWWTLPEAKAAFFRPLSSLSVYADHRLLPDWPWLFHLENLALYAAVIALVLALHRRVVADARLAALGALLFAVDDGHGITVGWLANRNALLAAVCGLGAVLWHGRAVQGSALHRVLAPAALAVALGFGEVALGAVAYLAAWALTVDARPAPRRVASLLPYLVVIAGWALTVRWLDFGVRGSDFYVDPADAPLRFLRTFPGWLLAVATSQLAGAPAADLHFVWSMLPWSAGAAAAAVAAAALGFIGRSLWPLLRSDPGARFFAAGAALCLCLATSTAPSDRNLLFAGVGAFGLVARLLGSLVDAPPEERSRRWLRRWLFGTHLVLAPLLLAPTALAPGLMDQFLKSASRAALSGAPQGQTLVLVQATNIVMTAFYLVTPSRPDEPRPRQVLSLAPSTDPLRVRREDERTLLLTLERGYFREPTAGIVRDSDHPLRAGEQFSVPGAKLTVVEVDEGGRAQVIRAAFEVPLEDPSLRWVEWTGFALEPFAPPPVGEERRVGG